MATETNFRVKQRMEQLTLSDLIRLWDPSLVDRDLRCTVATDPSPTNS